MGFHYSFQFLFLETPSPLKSFLTLPRLSNKDKKGIATEIVVASIGPAQCQETLRTALALGADRAILVKTDDEIQPLAVAKLLKEIV